tara:strand:- start:391 stop:534 length:144 start_codon:yes stop_codon:yes gene_type:complete
MPWVAPGLGQYGIATYWLPVEANRACNKAQVKTKISTRIFAQTNHLY